MKMVLIFIFAALTLVSCSYNDSAPAPKGASGPTEARTPNKPLVLLTEADLSRILAQSGKTLIEVSAELSAIANEKNVSVIDLDEELNRVLSIECDKVCLIQRKN